MDITLTKDKVTKNGVVRFGDGDGHNIYLQKEEVQSLDNPSAIKVTISKVA
jgi:hypothetical protein